MMKTLSVICEIGDKNEKNEHKLKYVDKYRYIYYLSIKSINHIPVILLVIGYVFINANVAYGINWNRKFFNQISICMNIVVMQSKENVYFDIDYGNNAILVHASQLKAMTNCLTKKYGWKAINPPKVSRPALRPPGKLFVN